MSYQLPEPPVVVRRDSIYLKFVATDAVRAELEDCAGLFTADQVLAAYLAGVEEAQKDKLDAQRYRTLRGSLGLYGKSHTQMPVVSVPFDREVGYLPHGLDEALDACIRALAADGLVERKP